MREILCRGKWKLTGEWLVGFAIQHSDTYQCIHDKQLGRSHVVDGKTIGEYSGFVDEKNRMIFEGDILSIKTKECGAHTGEVVFDSGAFCIKTKNTITPMRYVMDIAEVEIIGNVHDGGAENGWVKIA